MDLPGRPVEHHVIYVGLELVGRALSSALHQRLGGHFDRGTAGLQRTTASGPRAARHQVGVAEHETDLLHGDAGQVAGNHRERRGMTLAVG